MNLGRLLIAGLLLISATLMAQPGWKLDGQVRHRGEIDNRDFDSNTGPDNYNLLRTRLGATFTAEDSVSAYVQIQDSRFFGEESSTLTDGSADNMDVHQAYVQFRRFFGQPIHLKLGRMEVAYGSQRLIGSVGWSNTGRSFDGGILNIQMGKNSVDLFGFQEVESNETQNVGDKHVFGFNGFINTIQNHSIQPILVWQRSSPASVIDRMTAGFYLKGKPNNLTYEVDFAFQSGSVRDDNFQAMLAAANVLYTVQQPASKPTFGAGVDYLSGDDGEDTNTFDTMYATNHKFYGYMDYFLNIPFDTFRRGLLDLHLQFSIKPQTNTLLKMVFHKFDAVEELQIVDSKAFGNEFDFILQHRYGENVVFTGGFAFFLPGKLTEAFGLEDLSTWGFLETTVSF